MSIAAQVGIGIGLLIILAGVVFSPKSSPSAEQTAGGDLIAGADGDGDCADSGDCGCDGGDGGGD